MDVADEYKHYKQSACMSRSSVELRSHNRGSELHGKRTQTHGGLKLHSLEFSSVQLLSHVWLFATPWTVVRQASLSINNSQSLCKLMSIESVMPSNHLILCHPLLLLPSIFPSIRVFFQWVSFSHQVAKVLELQLQHLSFQWIFRIDSFRID